MVKMAALIKAVTRALVVVSVSGACASELDTPPPVAPAASAQREREVRFRTEVGLEADDGTLAKVGWDREASSADYGVPLRSAEVAQLAGRGSLQQSLWQLREYGARHARTFGGLYVVGGGVTYATTEPIVGDELVDFRRLIPDGVTVRIPVVRNSLVRLRRARSAMERARVAGHPAMRDVGGFGIRLSANRIEVAVMRCELERMRHLLETRYGAGLFEFLTVPC
jgi:hypothetical protein